MSEVVEKPMWSLEKYKMMVYLKGVHELRENGLMVGGPEIVDVQETAAAIAECQDNGYPKRLTKGEVAKYGDYFMRGGSWERQTGGVGTSLTKKGKK